MNYANRLLRYTAQTASLERYTEPDEYGNLQYAEAETVVCRKENKVKALTGEHGETVTSKAVFYVPERVRTMDKLNGNTIITVAAMVDRKGREIGWEAYV